MPEGNSTSILSSARLSSLLILCDPNNADITLKPICHALSLSLPLGVQAHIYFATFERTCAPELAWKSPQGLGRTEATEARCCGATGTQQCLVWIFERGSKMVGTTRALPGLSMDGRRCARDSTCNARHSDETTTHGTKRNGDAPAHRSMLVQSSSAEVWKLEGAVCGADAVTRTAAREEERWQQRSSHLAEAGGRGGEVRQKQLRNGSPSEGYNSQRTAGECRCDRCEYDIVRCATGELKTAKTARST